MKYNEVEKLMIEKEAKIRINNWYTGRPMYELYTILGKKLGNLQYRTVLKIELEHNTKTEQHCDYKLISILREKKGE